MSAKRAVAPQDMPKAGRKAWGLIVAEYPAAHFVGADLTLLEQLCRAVALADECGKQIERDGLVMNGRAHPLIAVRTQAWSDVRSCATKLRLTISSTLRPDAKRARPDPTAKLRKPWEM